MNNLHIRQLIKHYRLRHYEVADALGINEHTFCKWLRKEFTEERKKLVEDAIQTLVSKMER